MSPSDAGREPSAGRTAAAVTAGLVGGVAGVAITRAIFGPGALLIGAGIGLAVMVSGMVLSWELSMARRRRSASSGRRLRKRLHPVAWFGPVVGSAVAMLAWAGVAHSSGSGWVQAVGALLAAVLLIGLVTPAFPAHGATVTCTASPSDGEAGRTATVTLVASGPIRIHPLVPAGPVTRAEGPPHGSRRVEVDVVPDRRGVVGTLTVEVASSAPFGILWWAREIEVPLPRPLHVAPRFGQAGRLGSELDHPPGDSPTRAPSTAGEPRGVRPYQPGDARRSVHWPATSHTGMLMVRETEHRIDDPLVMDVRLPSDPLEAEAVSERAMATVGRELARGRTVILGTLEPEGHVTRPVLDRVDLGRRLARALSPPTSPSPSGGTGRSTPRGRR